MGTLKKEPVGREKGPDVVGALRDWVGSDHRIASTTETEGSDPGIASTTEFEEFDLDRTRTLTSAGSTYQEDPAQSGEDLFDADAGSSWASAHQNLHDFHIAPPIQGHFDPDHFQGDVSDGGVAKRRASDGPEEHVAAARPRSQAVPRAFSVIRRVADTLAYGLVSVAVLAVVVAFLSNDNLRLNSGSNRSATQTLSAGPLTSELNPVPQQQLAPSQLETIANDLASVQRSLEHLAARQGEMEQNIATLQASEQDLRQQLTTLSQAAVPISSARPRRHRGNR